MLLLTGMKKMLGVVVLVLTAAAVPAFGAMAAQLPVPNGSSLVGEASVTEIRAFPEEVHNKGGSRAVEEAQGVAGIDRLYESPESYSAAVSFLDRALAQDHFEVKARTVTRTSTIWSIKQPDGSSGRVAVRNTKPTTIEWVGAAAADQRLQPQR